MHPNIKCNTTTVAPAPSDSSSGCSSFKPFAVTSAGIFQTHRVVTKKTNRVPLVCWLENRWRYTADEGSFSIQFSFMTKVMFKRKETIPEKDCKRLYYFKCKFALDVLMFSFVFRVICYYAGSTRPSLSLSPHSSAGFTWLNTAHICGDRKWIRKVAQYDRNSISFYHYLISLRNQQRCFKRIWWKERPWLCCHGLFLLLKMYSMQDMS